MKIAIVGAEENKWKKEQKEKAIQLIDALLNFAVDGKLFLPPFHFTKTNTSYAVEGDTKKIDNNIILISGHCPKGKERWYCVDCKTWLDSFEEAETHIEVNGCDVIKVYDKGGVDTWVEIIAKELGIKTEIYAPEVNQWNDLITYQPLGDGTSVKVKYKGYRSRNIQIAEACDVLYDIEPTHSCKYCKGRGKIVGGGMLLGEGSSIQKCKFCEGDGAYSGGTWALKYARKLGKEVHKVIIE